LVKIFQDILTKEKIVFEIQALNQLALFSQGSLRDGINSLEKVFNFSNNITLLSVNKLYNVLSLEQKINFLIDILNQDINKIVLSLEKINNYLTNFKKFLIEMTYIVQDLLIYRLTNNIKISKYLTLEIINVFNNVTEQDLKQILNLFETIMMLNFDDESLKVLLVTKILTLFDQVAKYDLSYQQDDTLKVVVKSESEEQEIREKIVSNELESLSIKEKPQISNSSINNDVKIDRELFNNILNVIIQANKEIRKELKNY